MKVEQDTLKLVAAYDKGVGIVRLIVADTRAEAYEKQVEYFRVTTRGNSNDTDIRKYVTDNVVFCFVGNVIS